MSFDARQPMRRMHCGLIVNRRRNLLRFFVILAGQFFQISWHMLAFYVLTILSHRQPIEHCSFTVIELAAGLGSEMVALTGHCHVTWQANVRYGAKCKGVANGPITYSSFDW
jgi:hypothetical protein